jgi:hypothetical protein
VARYVNLDQVWGGGDLPTPAPLERALLVAVQSSDGSVSSSSTLIKRKNR